jgi:hypothetical protein
MDELRLAIDEGSDMQEPSAVGLVSLDERYAWTHLFVARGGVRYFVFFRKQGTSSKAARVPILAWGLSTSSCGAMNLVRMSSELRNEKGSDLRGLCTEYILRVLVCCRGLWCVADGFEVVFRVASCRKCAR